jgi:hypothetical protein
MHLTISIKGNTGGIRQKLAKLEEVEGTRQGGWGSGQGRG